MSEIELEKIKVRTSEHFENDKNNISWLKEGKSPYSWLSFSLNIVFMLINKKQHEKKNILIVQMWLASLIFLFLF